ncbi:hypothetical protein PS1_006655 [Malus domestica]
MQFPFQPPTHSSLAGSLQNFYFYWDIQDCYSVSKYSVNKCFSIHGASCYVDFFKPGVYQAKRGRWLEGDPGSSFARVVARNEAGTFLGAGRYRVQAMSVVMAKALAVKLGCEFGH